MRISFLLILAYTRCLILSLFLSVQFFFHTPAHAPPAAAAGAGPAAAAAPKERHQFQFLTLAYLARHSHGEIAHLFVERVMLLLSRPSTALVSPLPFAAWAAVIVLGTADWDKDSKARVEHFLESDTHARATATDSGCENNPRERCLIVGVCVRVAGCRYQIRGRRRLAVAAQHRFEAQQAASAPVEEKKPQKKKGRKSKGVDEEAEEMIDVEAVDRRTARVANGIFPEYALLDLLYILSYDPDFQDRLPMVRQRTTKT